MTDETTETLSKQVWDLIPELFADRRNADDRRRNSDETGFVGRINLCESALVKASRGFVGRIGSFVGRANRPRIGSSKGSPRFS